MRAGNGTLVGLPNAQLAIFGGRQNVGETSPVVPATTPELYDPVSRTWSSLSGAASSRLSRRVVVSHGLRRTGRENCS